MHSLITPRRPWLLTLGLAALACSHNTPTGAGNNNNASNSGTPSSATGNSVGSTNSGTTTTTAGSDTTAGGASASATTSGGAATTVGAGGSGGTGGMTSTIVPGAEGFDCTDSDGSMPSLQLTQLASDLDAPLGIYFAPGNSSRGYIILARGEILLLDGGNLSESPFLDISDRIQREEATYEERGLLGMAFHPDFPTNGKFFLHYTSGGADDGNGQNVISEFTVSGDPNVADAGSERVLLTVPQPNDNHNGGSLAIGLDGNLYIGVGDGGFEGVPTADAHGNGQNANTLLSAILRIGLDGSIPAGNMAGAAPEIWDIGIRNPWRMSFDGCTGDLYIGDVGFEGESASTEEIDVEPPLMGGRNYGWPIMEGEYCRDAGCDMSGFVLPTDSYAWDAGGAVIGGYVYRGSAIPGLRGTYIYADFQSAEFYAFEYAGGVAGNSREISSDLNPNGFSTGTIVSFGQDPSGEMYVIAWSGGDEMNRTRGDIYRIDPE